MGQHCEAKLNLSDALETELTPCLYFSVDCLAEGLPRYLTHGDPGVDPNVFAAELQHEQSLDPAAWAARDSATNVAAELAASCKFFLQLWGPRLQQAWTQNN